MPLITKVGRKHRNLWAQDWLRQICKRVEISF